MEDRLASNFLDSFSSIRGNWRRRIEYWLGDGKMTYMGYTFFGIMQILNIIGASNGYIEAKVATIAWVAISLAQASHLVGTMVVGPTYSKN